MFVFYNNKILNSITIIQDKNMIPKDIPYFEIESLPIKPNDESTYELAIKENFQEVYWKKIPGMDISDIKQERIVESKNKLADFLSNNPLYSDVHNSTFAYYNITQEKQLMLYTQFLGYTTLKATNPDRHFYWNSTGSPCEVWQETEVIQLIQQVQDYVIPLVSYQQKKEQAIKEALTREEVLNLRIDFNEIYSTINLSGINPSNGIILTDDTEQSNP